MPICVMCVVCVLCLIVVPLPPGENPFAVKINNKNNIFFLLVEQDFGYCGTGLLYQPQMIGDGDCGEIGGMKIGRGNRSTRRKRAPASLCPPQISHD
jgi:hypothetical protein